jgi:hypothetical protein
MSSSRPGLPPYLIRQAGGTILILGLFMATAVHGEPAAATNEEPPPPAVPDSVEVFGKIVDDVTGEPINAFLTQAGKFEPGEPGKVTWGYSETRNSSSNSFQATVKWKEGWTARIVADGYIPQPVLSEAPGKGRIEKVIRMKRGRIIRGRILDHLGKPVQGASVFAVRPHFMTLAGGKVVNSFDGTEDPSVRGVKSDEKGRFELPLTVPAEPAKADEDEPASKAVAPGFAISSPELDAWPVPLPDGNDESVIRLPKPTHVEVRYDIEGGEEEVTVFLQSLMHADESWKGFEIIRHIKVGNKGLATLTSLPPGRYQFARSRMLRHGNIGHGYFIDRQNIDVSSETPTTVSFERTSGARLSGSVNWDEETKLTGVILTVRKAPLPNEPPVESLFADVLDARLLRAPLKNANDKGENADASEKLEISGNRGLFLTERIPPGIYEVHAEGYAPMTQEQQFRTGIIRPTLTGSVRVTVPESGSVPSLKIQLNQGESRKAGAKEAK